MANQRTSHFYKAIIFHALPGCGHTAYYQVVRTSEQPGRHDAVRHEHHYPAPDGMYCFHTSPTAQRQGTATIIQNLQRSWAPERGEPICITTWIEGTPPGIAPARDTVPIFLQPQKVWERIYMQTDLTIEQAKAAAFDVEWLRMDEQTAIERARAARP